MYVQRGDRMWTGAMGQWRQGYQHTQTSNADERWKIKAGENRPASGSSVDKSSSSSSRSSSSSK